MQSSVRLWTTIEKTELIEQAAKAAVMDAQPIAQWTRLGMRGFLNHYGFPSFSWHAVDNARKKQYEKWVTGPLSSRLTMWKAPVRVGLVGGWCFVDGEALAVRVSGRLAVESERGQYRIGGARREKCQNSRYDPQHARFSYPRQISPRE